MNNDLDYSILQAEPVDFIELAFGEDLWAKQQEIAASVQSTKYTVVRSCHGSGKSRVAADIALWFLHSFPHSKVITTAPTFRQVEDILWREIRSARTRSRIRLGGKVNNTSIDISEQWFALGLSTDDSDRFQGFHAPYILLIVDEAAGVTEEIFNASEGIVSSGHARVLYIGNPTNVEGTFYRSFKMPGYARIHISAFDTPNFTTFGITLEDIRDNTWEQKIVAELPRPYLVTPEWVYDKYLRWGEGNPMWDSRVMGNFPEQGEDSLIPLGKIEAARNRYLEVKATDPEQVGIDVARFGCFDDQTELLTSAGWRKFVDVTGQERVLSVNPNGIASWEDIDAVHVYPFDGELNLLETRSVNFCITDNHKLLVKTRREDPEWKLREFDDAPKQFVLRRSNSWVGENPEMVTITSRCPMPHGGVRKTIEGFKFDDWAELLGWFISEGNVYVERRYPKRYRILITQYPGEKREHLRQLLDRMGVRYRLQNNQFEFWHKDIGKHLRQQCGVGAANKRIPRYLKESSPSALWRFLEGFRLGDGTCRADGKGIVYATSSRKLADDIQEVLAKLGVAGKLSLSHKKGSTFVIDGRKIIRLHDVYVIYQRCRPTDTNIKKSKVRRIRYSGSVYCVSTKYKSIMVRRNGCPMWSGNSDKSEFAYRKGPKPLDWRTYNHMDTMETASRVRDFASLRPAAEVGIDEVGVGAGVYDRVAQLLPDQHIYGVNVGQAAFDSEQYANLRAEIFWGLRERFIAGDIDLSELSQDVYEDLSAQLSQIKFKYTARNQLQIEKKEEMKKRGLVSPDKADALALAFGRLKGTVSYQVLDLQAVKQQATATVDTSDPATRQELERQADLKIMAEQMRQRRGY